MMETRSLGSLLSLLPSPPAAAVHVVEVGVEVTVEVRVQELVLRACL